MIRIRKRPTAPSPLTTLGLADRQRLEAIYTADPAACQAPRNKFLEADPATYGHEDVKKAVIDDQHEKCCYCEAKFTANGFGDVEHFRPKAGVRQQPKAALEKPGYYWLAYEWSNLFFSCEICNQRYKGNLFPLLNPSRRARHHGQSVGRERTLLPDPGTTNPGRYLKFNKHVITASTPRGKTCIKAYGLDRDTLNRRREEFLETLKIVRLAADLDLDNLSAAKLNMVLADLGMTLKEARQYVDLAREVWEQAAFDKSEYAGMVRDNFRRLPRKQRVGTTRPQPQP